MNHEKSPEPPSDEPASTASAESQPEQPGGWSHDEQVGDVYAVDIEPGNPPKIPEHRSADTAEADPTSNSSPELFIGSVADHTAVTDHGVWVDATLDIEDIKLAIQEMLRTSPALRAGGAADGSGTWAIHDYRGFGVTEIYEDHDLDYVHAMAVGIRQYGPAFSAWAEINYGDFDRWSLFEEAYLGEFNSLGAYGDHLIAEMGWQQVVDDALPEAIARHVRINGTSLAHDMWLGGDIQISHKPGGGAWIFRGDT